VTVGHAIFRPIIVVDGRVVGIWKRTLEKSATRIEYTFFEELKRPRLTALEKATKLYGMFEGRPALITQNAGVEDGDKGPCVNTKNSSR
jgi:hypothetical protein